MRIFLGVLLILIGLSALTGVSFVQYLFAIFFILIGVRILSGRSSWRDRGDRLSQKSVVNEDYLNTVLVFSAINRAIKSDNFKGGKIIVVFGGGVLDLSEVKIAGKEIEIEMTAIFGGLKVYVPENWRISSEGVGIMGGYANKTTSAKNEVQVKIKGNAIFGGIEILNG